MKQLLNVKFWYLLLGFFITLSFVASPHSYASKDKFYKVSTSIDNGPASVVEKGKISHRSTEGKTAQYDITPDSDASKSTSLSATLSSTEIGGVTISLATDQRSPTPPLEGVLIEELVGQGADKAKLVTSLTDRKIFFPIPQAVAAQAGFPIGAFVKVQGVADGTIFVSPLTCTNCACECSTESDTEETYCAECTGCCTTADGRPLPNKCEECKCCIPKGSVCKCCSEVGAKVCKGTQCSSCDCMVRADDAKDNTPVFCCCCESGNKCACADQPNKCPSCNCCIAKGTKCECCPEGGDKNCKSIKCKQCACMVRASDPKDGASDSPICVCCSDGKVCPCDKPKLVCSAGNSAKMTLHLSQDGKSVSKLRIETPHDDGKKVIEVEFSGLIFAS